MIVVPAGPHDDAVPIAVKQGLIEAAVRQGRCSGRSLRAAGRGGMGGAGRDAETAPPIGGGAASTR
jgi:hypothetical protein